MLEELINHFLAFFSKARKLRQVGTLPQAETLLGPCKFGGFEKDETAIFVPNSLGRHNALRIMRGVMLIKLGYLFWSKLS